jgi:hypothetical protein
MTNMMLAYGGPGDSAFCLLALLLVCSAVAIHIVRALTGTHALPLCLAASLHHLPTFLHLLRTPTPVRAATAPRPVQQCTRSLRADVQPAAAWRLSSGPACLAPRA